ncbi:hypothetical protein [Arthrobacter sp. NA-172]|uniref:hypothetical protein n=1 Tax=Arthrobacter sp. NA-172 TaxID=3367524 RepID=UPI003754D53A
MTATLKIAFVCPGKFSFGELQNAITVAWQLPATVEAEFLASDQYLNLALGSGVAAHPIPTGPRGNPSS